MVREPDATRQPTPQDNQLMSKHRVLSLKPQLRLERRGQDGQNETEQPDHSASLGDSITSSTQIRFSVHTGLTNSPHPSSREGHPSTARWNLSFLLLGLILNGFHAAAAACSRVQRNSVPSIQMRCMITASRRASATIAFFIPRRLAICMAQVLSQHHFFECIML